MIKLEYELSEIAVLILSISGTENENLEEQVQIYLTKILRCCANSFKFDNFHGTTYGMGYLTAFNVPFQKPGKAVLRC